MFAASYPTHNIFLLTVVIIADAPLRECVNMADGAAGIHYTTDGKISDAELTHLMATFQFDGCAMHLTAGGATHFGGAIFSDTSLERTHSGGR
jgi:hypothetical protein